MLPNCIAKVAPRETMSEDPCSVEPKVTLEKWCESSFKEKLTY